MRDLVMLSCLMGRCCTADSLIRATHIDSFIMLASRVEVMPMRFGLYDMDEEGVIVLVCVHMAGIE